MPACSVVGKTAPVTAFALFVVLGCGLWFAKNAALTGNPVYPLLYDVSAAVRARVEKNEQWIAAHDPPNSDLSDLAARAGASRSTATGSARCWCRWPALGFLTPQRRTAWRLAAYLAFVFCTWWLFTHRIDRFWVPVLPVVALLAGIGATWSTARWWRITLLLLLGVGLLSNFVVITVGRLRRQSLSGRATSCCMTTRGASIPGMCISTSMRAK